MYFKITFYVSLSILITAVCFCNAVNSQKHPSDPSVLDETDINVIDTFLKQADKNKSSDGNPSRGSLAETTIGTTSQAPLQTTLPPMSLSTPQQTPVSSQESLTKHQEVDGPCKCVKYYLCNVNASTNSSHDAHYNHSQEIVGIVDIRKGDITNATVPISNSTSSNSTVHSEQQCDDYLDVCCPLKQIKPVNNSHENSQSSTAHPTIPSLNADSSQQNYHTYCGRRNENGTGVSNKVILGDAQFGEFPWTAAIIELENLENNPNVTVNKYVGGGSLLHPQVVLTVAHNVLGKSRTTLKVRLGEYDTQTNDEPYPSQDRQVKKIIIHEEYVKTTLFNDVALLILDEEVHFAPNVDTICLPPSNKKLNFDGQMCYSAGWGKDHFGAEGRYSEIMKKVKVPVVPKATCQEELSKSDKLPGFILHKSFLCAGGKEAGEDTCKGDGGSALVCAISDKIHTHYVQVGAVSFGIGCGTKFPGVYADITVLTPWILSKMEQEGFSTEYCTIRE